VRIIVGTDGSADANGAIDWLAHLPLPADADVEVVSVIPRPIIDESVVPTPWSEFRRETEAVVDDARGRLAKRWPHVRARVLHGDARHAIVDAAARAHADLIVVGARGLGGVRSFLLGSVSLGIARHAPCAVLVCKGPARPVRTVTMALDSSPDATAAATFVATLPLPADCTVRLVGVVQPLGRYPSSAPGVSPALVPALEEYENALRRELQPPLERAKQLLGPRVHRVLAVTPVGLPAEVIASDARTSHADLVVVGARGLGPLSRVLLGSVSESVLGHAECPVLVARAPAAGATAARKGES
jgi:nucleotide-binding universal stress UspA family protein